MDFLQLGVSKELREKLKENGITQPTPIQEQAIPAMMKGLDVIAQAQTGTGKTLAFLLPILEKVKPHPNGLQALIVTPTRELALQITAEVHKLIDSLPGIEALAVYGGQDVEKQLKKLKKEVQIVVATPGRLLDHLRRGTIHLQDISSLVLDEADQMLHIGFLNEVEEIIEQTPRTRQTMLFSATIPAEIRKLAKQYMNNPQYIQVEKIQGPALTVKQLAIHTTDRGKQGALIDQIKLYRPFLAVIFCRTKRRVSRLYEILTSQGFSCAELHGDISQGNREKVMKRFRNAEFQLLIATDVAARGLDVEGVTHVFNYDIPQDADSYVHRIGRTGRAGMDGLALTFFSSQDRPVLETIERDLHIRIPKKSLEKTEEKDRKQDHSRGKQKAAAAGKRKSPAKPRAKKKASSQYGKSKRR